MSEFKTDLLSKHAPYGGKVGKELQAARVCGFTVNAHVMACPMCGDTQITQEGSWYRCWWGHHSAIDDFPRAHR